jgi:tetratricopeptide (TPR) repeat protein
MKSMIFVIFVLLGSGEISGQSRNAKNLKTTSDCDRALESAEIYEITNNPQAEAAFRSIAATSGNKCPRVFLELSENLTRNLKFREAAEMMRAYVRRVPAKARGYDENDVRKLQNAAELQERVIKAPKPRLRDLLELTHQIRGFGRKHDFAIPYAEKAVALYPDSVAALLMLIDVLPRTQNQKDKVEQLLNQAAALEPNNAKIYSMRGWWNFRTFRNLDDAEKDFRRALSLSNGTNLAAWQGLGYLFMERGQKHDAILAFRKYQGLRPVPDSEITQMLKNLERDHTP